MAKTGVMEPHKAPPKKRRRSAEWRTMEGTWLDRLPLDVCVHVTGYLRGKELDPWQQEKSARFAFEPRHYPHLALSEVSTAQKHAVVSVTDRVNISLDDVFVADELIARSRALLNDIREVVLHHEAGVQDYEYDLLTLPTIRKVVVPNHKRLLYALITGGSVKSVTLNCLYKPVGQFEKNLLGELVITCKLDHLHLTCRACNNYERSRCNVTVALESFTRPMPSVRSLRLTTASRPYPLDKVTLFENLEEFRLERAIRPQNTSRSHTVEIPDVMEDRLRRMKSVGFVNCGRVSQFFGIGDRLTALSTNEVLTEETIQELEHFPNLHSVHLVLTKYAICYFPHSLHSIRSLSMTWNRYPQLELHGEHYDTPPGCLSCIVAQNKQLTELRLDYVKLSREELEFVLKATAEKLEVLHVPIFRQGESPRDRFLTLARLIMVHNRNLVELQVCRQSRHGVLIPDRPMHDAGICDPDVCHFCELAQAIEFVIPALKRRCLRFCDDGLMMVLKKLEKRKESERAGWSDSGSISASS